MNKSGEYLIKVGFVVAVVCSGCKHMYTAPQASIGIESRIVSGVALLSFDFSYDSAQGHSIVNLLSIKEAMGLFSFGNPTSSETHFVITQFDEEGNALISNQFDHPLFRPVEYLDEGGIFKRVMITQRETSILIQIPVYANTVEYKLVEVIQGKEVFTNNFKR